MTRSPRVQVIYALTITLKQSMFGRFSPKQLLKRLLAWYSFILFKSFHTGPNTLRVPTTKGEAKIGQKVMAHE